MGPTGLEPVTSSVSGKTKRFPPPTVAGFSQQPQGFPARFGLLRITANCQGSRTKRAPRSAPAGSIGSASNLWRSNRAPAASDLSLDALQNRATFAVSAIGVEACIPCPTVIGSYRSDSIQVSATRR